MNSEKTAQQDYRYTTTYKLYLFGVTEYGDKPKAAFLKSNDFSVRELHMCQIKGKPFGTVCLEINKTEKQAKGKGKRVS